MERFDSSELPAFRPRAPWWGPDLQTLRNVLTGAHRAGLDGERIKLLLADGSGDALVGSLAPSGGSDKPLAVLIHGLSGSEDSAYMLASARHLRSAGHPVLRLNLRGAGPSREHCRLQYHAGRTSDLRDALRALEPGLVENGIVLVGYSLGGNMLLKFLAEYAEEFPIVAAASVSAPIDLAAASQRFLDSRNRFYHWNLLRSMKRESLLPGAHVSASEREAIAACRSVYEFDQRFVAPRNGYASAEDYYADNMARRFLAEIPIPTLVIQALDDPWIPAQAYTSFDWTRNARLVPLLASGGGHVGFHGAGADSTWHDRCALQFFATHAVSSDSTR